MTSSRFTAVADSRGNVRMPPAEGMFTAATDGVWNERLQEVLPSRRVPKWFTVYADIE